MTLSDSDSHMRDLLHQTTDAMPSSGDLTKRILHQIHEDKASQSRLTARRARGKIAGSLSVTAAVIVIVGLLAFLLAQHAPARSPAPSIASTNVAIPGIVDQVAPVTNEGVTLQVLHTCLC
jgi:hypothetical protein